jgi:hypothetical protein
VNSLSIDTAFEALARFDTARIAGLMIFEAATLAIASVLHLAAGGIKLDGAGVPEAIICAVLVAGAASLWGLGSGGRSVAVGATSFAIFGFIVGLASTITGGSAFDLGYHLIMLPILIPHCFSCAGRPGDLLVVDNLLTAVPLISCGIWQS